MLSRYSCRKGLLSWLNYQGSLEGYVYVCSVMSDSLQPHGLQPARLLCPWNFPGKNTGAGCHFLFQGIVLTQGSNLCLLHLLQWQADSLALVPLGKTRVLLMAMCVCMQSPFSCVWLFVTLWTVATPPLRPPRLLFRARILEWVIISSSRGSSQPRDQTRISYASCISRWVLYLNHLLTGIFLYIEKVLSA